MEGHACEGELDLDDGAQTVLNRGALAGLDHGVKHHTMENQVVVVKSLKMGTTRAVLVEQKPGQSFWLRHELSF